MRALKPCLNCGLGFRFSRGNCRKCFHRNRRLVIAGLTTWAELEALGKTSVPSKAGGVWKSAWRRGNGHKEE